jgi:hypothetical protein
MIKYPQELKKEKLRKLSATKLKPEEYCSCGMKDPADDGSGKCMNCGLRINFKPTEVKQELSACCLAPVKIEGEPDFPGDKHACTQYYVCTNCGKPCDRASEEKAEEIEEIDIASNLTADDVVKRVMINKINELVRAFNKKGEEK